MRRMIVRAFLVGHLIGNRASFLCTKAPMIRIPETNFLQGITSDIGEMFRRSSAVATSIDFAAQLRQSLIFEQTDAVEGARPALEKPSL